jgi:5-hydroxyisourate hydrolase-like protein (transthyretin family)
MNLPIVAFAVLLLGQQPQQQPQVIRGRIEGTVLREGTTEPVPGARVTVTRVNASTGTAVPTAGTIGTFLINGTPNVPPPPAPPPAPAGGAVIPPPPAPQPAPIPPVITDRTGKFVVPDLEGGAYRVAVTLNGYVKMEYGQRSFAGQGTTLTLTPGETMKDLVIRMTRAGNVSGRLSDESGQPASGVPVQLLKVTYNPAGIRLFQQAGTARTNDRGEYRIYWITPGRYLLAAGTPPGIPPGGGPGGNPTPNETPDPYVFTYYPGTNDQSRATVVDVKAGAELPMDFVVPRTQLFKISGKIVGANTPANAQATAPAVNISLAFLRYEGGSGFIMMSQTYDPATGDFTLRNIVPGSYAVQATTGTLNARAAVEVVNTDITNLTLTLNGGINVTGKAQTPTGAAVPPQTRIQLRPILKGVSHFVGAVPAAQVAPADGTFRLDRVLAGQYRASVTAPGHYVKELRFEGGDALNAPIELEDGRSGTPAFDVVLSPNVAQIDGVVTDDKGQPLMGVQAVLVPDRNRDRTELFKSAATDQTGRFSMRDVAPGDYKLFAWDGLENFAYFEPNFVAPYEQQGKPVRVEESAKLSVDTRIIPEKR